MQELTSETFEEFISSDEISIVDFMADWCMPCKMLSPVLEELAAEYRIGSVDTEHEMNLALSHSVNSIPSLVFFRNGKEVKRMVGVSQKKAIIEAIQSLG